MCNCKDESCGCGCSDCSCGSNHGSCETPDLVDHMMEMWHKAFLTAKLEAMTSRLKVKIEAAYGPVMDDAAEAVFEAVGKVMSSKITESEAKEELKGKLTKLISEAKK